MSNSDYHVLVVDDEEDLAELAADAFEMEDFKVTQALSGKEALAAMERETVHVVISDQNMPEMSGNQLLDAIKEKYGDDRPLFYLSTGAIDITDEDIKEKGGTGLIAKPYNLDEIVQVVLGGLQAKA